METKQQGSKPNNKKAAIPKILVLPQETNPILTKKTQQKATKIRNPKALTHLEWSYLSTKMPSSKHIWLNRKNRANHITKRQFPMNKNKKTYARQKVDPRMMKFRPLLTKNTTKSQIMIDLSFTLLMKTKNIILLMISSSLRSGKMKSHFNLRKSMRG